ncbi:MAG: type II toxin-antitoxin system VapC family toxin [Truepera sp.]|nr:type II toxin-antitoxin system VapC family toxin [Truepera sp.]
MSAVLDASALLALLRDEPGAERVEAVLERGAQLSAVNLAEVLSKLADLGEDPQEAQATMVARGLLGGAVVVVPFTEEDALAVARLRAYTQPLGLSLADRACLGLAKRLGLVALTADQVWERLAGEVQVEVIR